uniref:Uncharacterized protein n=1 Tax=Romanomermis culicivorax TaxID=13658 RepID=A0A915L5S8_ROMCU
MTMNFMGTKTTIIDHKRFLAKNLTDRSVDFLEPPTAANVATGHKNVATQWLGWPGIAQNLALSLSFGRSVIEIMEFGVCITDPSVFKNFPVLRDVKTPQNLSNPTRKTVRVVFFINLTTGCNLKFKLPFLPSHGRQ